MRSEPVGDWPVAKSAQVSTSIVERFQATVIDGAVQVFLWIGAVIAIFVQLPDHMLSLSDALLLLLLLTYVVIVFYGILVELLWRGSSPGKRLVGLAVRSVDGNSPAPIQLLIRNLARPIDWFPLGYLVGYLVLTRTARLRRVGDLLAGTVVVESTEEALVSPGHHMSTEHFDSPATVITVETSTGVLPPEVAGLIRSYFDRRTQMPYQERDTVARRIASVAQRYLGDSGPEYVGLLYSLEAYLSRALAEYDRARDDQNGVL